jgi:integrase
LGFFTGLRLKDCLTVRWRNIDLTKKALVITPAKTASSGKKLTLPIHPDLEAFLLEHPSSESEDAFVFPSLAHLGVGGNNGASRRFQKIMHNAGIGSGVLREKAGKSGRAVKARTFHSMRHTFTTALSAANVSVELRQKLTGHASEGQNLHYTHPEFKQLQGAMDLLPSLDEKPLSPSVAETPAAKNTSKTQKGTEGE